MDSVASIVDSASAPSGYIQNQKINQHFISLYTASKAGQLIMHGGALAAATGCRFLSFQFKANAAAFCAKFATTAT
jgi:hypothetical protein